MVFHVGSHLTWWTSAVFPTFTSPSRTTLNCFLFPAIACELNGVEQQGYQGDVMRAEKQIPGHQIGDFLPLYTRAPALAVALDRASCEEKPVHRTYISPRLMILYVDKYRCCFQFVGSVLEYFVKGTNARHCDLVLVDRSGSNPASVFPSARRHEFGTRCAGGSKTGAREGLL